MPNPPKKLLIFAAEKELVLQPWNDVNHQYSVRIQFEDVSITKGAKAHCDEYKERPSLLSYGIIGLFNFKSFTFLFCITRRERVARLLEKSVYLIKDVSVVPITTSSEAHAVIRQAQSEVQNPAVADLIRIPSDGLDDDGSNVGLAGDLLSPVFPTPATGADIEGPDRQSVLRGVLEKSGQYGASTSQWLFKRAWLPWNDEVRKLSGFHCNPAQAGQTRSSSSGYTPKQEALYRTAGPKIPQFLASAQLLLKSGGFYFAYDINITKNLANTPIDNLREVSAMNIEREYYWNHHLAAPFQHTGCQFAILPILQGFVGQEVFEVNANDHSKPVNQVEQSAKTFVEVNRTDSTTEQASGVQAGSNLFVLTMVSRRSSKRAGLRYLRRGIDDDGYCANSVETEQILSSPKSPFTLRSFIQIRASLPLYFSQSPYAFRPVPVLHQTPETNWKAFKNHFQRLQRTYGDAFAVLLVDKDGNEQQIGKEYEALVETFNKKLSVPQIGFTWFDFHKECRGMKFENVENLVCSLEDTLTSYGYTWIDEGVTKIRQRGVIRTNCMDCLDRTNVVQTAFAQRLLQAGLEKAGFRTNFMHVVNTQWFNRLWANNGDAISRQYASTDALKGDYTRTRKRNYRGALNDLGLTLNRYYHNMVNDFYTQAIVDLLLGNITPTVFEDLEASTISNDPGISIDNIRQHAIESCTEHAISDQEEELICGWVMLVPAQRNTIRTLPFEEAVILLSDRAVYECRFDWDAQKIISIERVDHQRIQKIHFGVYITSTLTNGQMDEDLNAGVVLTYRATTDTITAASIATPVRSDAESSQGRNETKEANGILSRLYSRDAQAQGLLGFKVIPSRNLRGDLVGSMPNDTAKEIGQEIQRAVIQNSNGMDEVEIALLEATDIITPADARRRTGYLEQMGHSVKRYIWA